MQLVEKNFAELVLPTLLPIYGSNTRDATRPDQVGTGFILKHESRPMMVTAKHTLFGHDGNEDAGEKAFHNNGELVFVGDVDSKMFFICGRDIACFYADQLADRPCLEIHNVQAAAASIITIGGYLTRDLRREGATLKPKPYTFTNVSEQVSDGLVGLQYRRSKVKSTDSEMRQTAPIPRGLSGGPMLNSAHLARGRISLVGVFTEQDGGSARGEPSEVLKQILAAV